MVSTSTNNTFGLDCGHNVLTRLYNPYRVIMGNDPEPRVALAGLADPGLLSRTPLGYRNKRCVGASKSHVGYCVAGRWGIGYLCGRSHNTLAMTRTGRVLTYADFGVARMTHLFRGWKCPKSRGREHARPNVYADRDECGTWFHSRGGSGAKGIPNSRAAFCEVRAARTSRETPFKSASTSAV